VSRVVRSESRSEAIIHAQAAGPPTVLSSKHVKHHGLLGWGFEVMLGV
jgi:hypothetical protein